MIDQSAFEAMRLLEHPLVGLLLGLIVGSFLATILIRWPAGESVSTGRSRCDCCQAELRVWELVPVLSFLASRGRCRRCGGRIDRRHLAIELAAAMVGLVAWIANPGPAGLATAVLGWWILLLAAIDAEHYWLPDRLTLPLLAVGIAVAGLGVGPSLTDRIVGATAGFVVLAAIGAAYRIVRRREGLGGGDPKLLAAIGAWLGWQQLPLVLLGAGLAGIFALLLARLRGETVSATSRLPLGTLMAIVAWPLWILQTAA